MRYEFIVPCRLLFGKCKRAFVKTHSEKPFQQGIFRVFLLDSGL